MASIWPGLVSHLSNATISAVPLWIIMYDSEKKRKEKNRKYEVSDRVRKRRGYSTRGVWKGTRRNLYCMRDALF